MNYEVSSTADAHFEHTTWGLELSFWENEQKTFKNRLEQLVHRWTDKRVLALLEHFQMMFIIHGDVIDELQDEISAYDIKMAKQNKENLINSACIYESRHIKFREKMEAQRSIYSALKRDLFKFLAKYL